MNKERILQNYLPPNTVVQPVRRRRSAKRKKSPVRLSPGQVIALAVLGIAMLIAVILSSLAGTKLTTLRGERARAAEEFANQVSRHTVKYRDWIEHYAAYYNVDPAYIAAVILRESSYNPTAVSSANARGLMQLMPDTGTWMAEKAGIRDYTLDMLFDPETNIRLGTRYIDYLAGKFDGDPILIACGYHAGAGNVDAWLKKYSRDGKTLAIEEIPMADTRSYAGKVLNAYAIYQQFYY